jgi:DNA-binding protein YbaB
VVRITMTGKQEITTVVIEPEAAEDIDLLQDLVAAAVNDAFTRTQELAAEKMGAVTGGMNIPGLF